MKLRYLYVLSLLLLFSQGLTGAPTNTNLDIPYQKFVLDNGLTVLVHEDHKAPVVAVNVWYHVGSKNEKPGKTGFAHVFEHLMFNGSENFNDDYFQAIDRVGATDRNGTTGNDRTNYFENVPVSSMDVALWLESDRMGHLIGAITQDKLDEQRGVVQNEKRQYENQPYAVADELITTNCFPKGHPYSWTVIGSMDDLNAASLEDVHEWFKTYYGAANAVVSIAGDVQTADALEKVKEYFGDVPPGPPVATHERWIAKRRGVIRESVEDRVPQSRLYMVWNIPEWGSEGADYLDLVSDVLASGKSSRFYKRLVYKDQIATDVNAYVDLREIAGLFYITADVKPGHTIDEVESAINEELSNFLKNGPSKSEMKRIKTQYMSRFIRRMERIGGFGGKSDILAKNEVYTGNPEHYKITLQRIQAATRDDLKNTARNWLSDGVYILEVRPFPKYHASGKDVDRSKLPETGEPPAGKFPELQRTTLSNGLQLILAERHNVPLVNFSMVIDAGYAADQLSVPGTAKLAMNMLDEGTTSRSALEINDALAQVGARLSTNSDLDASTVFLSALKSKIEPSLDLFADVILHPAFPEDDFKRLQSQQITSIQREQVTPMSMAMRVFPSLLYGKNHAYGNPVTGSGTIESVKTLNRNDLRKFHATWFHPNNATLVVVGDITMGELKPVIESRFDKWETGEIPEKNIAAVQKRQSPVVYIVDRPGSIQSMIFASNLTLPQNNPDEAAVQTFNNIIGGEFTSRINMNLREDKHWTYGSRSFLWSAKGPRPFVVYAPVQSDKTAESMVEIRKELTGIIGNNPPTESEFDRTQKNQILQLPGSWETIRSVESDIDRLVKYGLDDAYYQTQAERIHQLSLTDMQEIANKIIHPDQMVWVVVGDRSKIEGAIKDAGFTEIHSVDPDGNILD